MNDGPAGKLDAAGGRRDDVLVDSHPLRQRKVNKRLAVEVANVVDDHTLLPTRVILRDPAYLLLESFLRDFPCVTIPCAGLAVKDDRAHGWRQARSNLAGKLWAVLVGEVVAPAGEETCLAWLEVGLQSLAVILEVKVAKLVLLEEGLSWSKDLERH